MPVDTEKGRTMRPFAHLMAALAALSARLEADDPERGDVPGWVMITVMTAALVLAILVPFRTAIVDAVTNALTSVTSAG
jgi:hypothetical protein